MGLFSRKNDSGDVYDKWMAKREKHYCKFFGPLNQKVMHSTDVKEVHIDIYRFKPNRNRPYWTLITGGMSDERQNVPDDVDWASPRTEILTYVKEPHERVFSALKLLAEMSFEEDSYMHWFHTISVGEPVTKRQTELTCAFLVPPAFEKPEFDTLHIGGDKVDFGVMPYTYDEALRVDIKSTDILRTIRQRFPDFSPSAYLNGTEQPDSFKWLLSGRLGTKERVYGYVGPKFMELAQTTHHFRHGSYLAYTSPTVMERGRSMLLLSPLDRQLRRTAGAYLRALALNPMRALRKLRFQSVMIIQPVDILPDGRQNMCDSCPDMTVWNGRLAWSCRLEEPSQYGGFMRSVPKKVLPKQPDAH